MKNTLVCPAVTHLRITALLLSFFLSIPLMTVNAEKVSKAANTNASVAQSSVKVPANVATWMDNELRKAKRKTLLTKEAFFTQDSATVVGYIVGYHADLGFTTVMLDASNDLTKKKRPIVSAIDSMGRFTCAIVMNFPRMVTISFGDEFMDLYLEPGQTLAMSFDWKDCVRTDCFRNVKEANQVLMLQGPLARLNYELKAFKLKTLGFHHYWIVDSYSPQAYLAVIDSILVENEASVKEALASGKYLKKTIEIQRNDALIANGSDLLDYAWKRDTNGVTLPRSFYKKLQQLPLNDPACIISGSYDMFINRLEVNPIFWKGNNTLNRWGSRDSLLKSDLNLSNNFCYEVTKIRSLSIEFENMHKSEAYDYYYQLQAGIKHPYLKQEGFRILTSRFGKVSGTDKLTDGGLSVPANTAKQPKWTPRLLSKGVDADIFNQLMAPHKGKYVFVDFWGTSCGPCRWHINALKKTREKFANNPDFDFVFITCKDWSPNKKDYDDYVKEQGLKHSYLISNDDFNYMMQLFRFTGLPHSVFIDPEGNVLDTDFSDDLGTAIKWIQDK